MNRNVPDEMLHRAHLSSPPRRLLRKILISAAALVVLILVAAEIILSTDLPRNFVIAKVEKQLGLRIAAQSLSTGLFGYTTLQDVTVTLPLSDKAFLAVPELKLHHTWLPGVLIGILNIHDMSIDRPKLEVVEDAAGSWNLQEVAQLLARAAGGKNATQPNNQPNDIPELPALDVNDASITITDNRGRSTTLQHLQITGRPDGPLVWQYRADIPDQLDLNGNLAPGDAWAHRVDIQIKNAQSWLAPWVSSWPADAHVQARWSGRIDSGNVQGRFEIVHANYNSLSVSGPLEVSSDQSSATFRPSGVLISNASAHALDARIVGGNILFNAIGIQSQNLGLEFAQGRANLDAKYTFADNSASLHAAWRDLALPTEAVHSGDLQLEYSAPLGQPRFKATLQDAGTVKSVQWDAALSLSGTGNTLKTLSLTLVAPKLHFDAGGGKSLDLSGLTADLGAYADGLLLRDVRVGHAHPLSGLGGYSLADKTAWLCLDGHGWPMPGAAGNTLDVDFNLWSNPTRIHLQQFYLNAGAFSANVNGDYVYNLPKPLNAHAHLTERPKLLDSEAQINPFRGSLQSTIDLNGTVNPLDLLLTGSARGNDVRIGQRPIGDVNLNLTGYFRNDLIYISSENVQALGGAWNISGYWPMRDELFRIDNLSVQHLSLPLAFDSNNVAGSLDGKWSIDVHELTPSGIVVDGSTDIHNLVIGDPHGAAAQYLVFDEIHIPHTSLQYGMIDLKPITLTRKIGDTSGAAEFSVSTLLAHPRQLTIGVDAKNWPIQVSGNPNACRLSANGKLDLDLAKLAALGHLDLEAQTLHNSKSIGQLQASIDLNRRIADITHVQIKTLDGSANGRGTFNLDQPFTSRFGLNWKNFDLASLKSLSPALATLLGKTDGALRIQPSVDPRPLGPLAIELLVHSNGIQIRNARIGDLQAYAFCGPDRIVLDDSLDHPSQLAIAGGIIRFWGRTTKHTDGIYQSLLQLNLENLNLDAVLPAGAKVARTPGLLSGQITLLGDPRQLNLLSGQGSLSLEKSDLAGTGPIALLYNTMHLAHDANKPTGSGQIDLMIQNQALTITALHYFDKGSETRISGEISDLLSLPHSPINLIAVGSMRPLASIHIPGLGDFDDALGAIQHDVFAERITGYFDNPQRKLIPFTDIGRDMKNLLFGDIKAAME